jgi:hypothetical protein
MILALGVLISAAGAVLLLNLFGAGDMVIHRVTSRSLGELAPGYAATPRGFRVYAALVLAIGVVCDGIGVAGSSIQLAAGLIVLGVVAFAIASVIAIAGEVTVYRGLKR